MKDHDQKLKNFVYEKIKDIKEPNILEFGVRDGISTKMFIELCESQSGSLYSVDKNIMDLLLKVKDGILFNLEMMILIS